MNEYIKFAAKKTRALNHLLRSKIIHYLMENGEKTVTEIHTHFKVEQPVASQHLNILRKANFVKTERKGQFIIYSANITELERFSYICQEIYN